MSLFSFGSKKDDLGRQLDAQKEQQEMDGTGAPAMSEGEAYIAAQRDAGKAELTRWQQDLEDDIKMFENELRNKFKNDKGNWVSINGIDKKELGPMCSETCIMKLVTQLRPCLSKNLMMSKMEMDQILNYLNQLSNTLTLDILIIERIRNRKTIKLDTCSQIIRIFQSYANPTFFRALGANEKHYLGDITTSRHLTFDGQKPQVKKGFLGLGGT